MKLLIAADSAISAEVLVGAVGVRPWPAGTTAHVLSVVVDADVPLEVWREAGYGKAGVRREMEMRGDEITRLAVDRLKEVGIPAEVVVRSPADRPARPRLQRLGVGHLRFQSSLYLFDFESAPPHFVISG